MNKAWFTSDFHFLKKCRSNVIKNITVFLYLIENTGG